MLAHRFPHGGLVVLVSVVDYLFCDSYPSSRFPDAPLAIAVQVAWTDVIAFELEADTGVAAVSSIENGTCACESYQYHEA